MTALDALHDIVYGSSRPHIQVFEPYPQEDHMTSTDAAVPTVYVLVDPSWVAGTPTGVAYALGTMSSYEPDIYHAAIADQGLDAVADQEWADGWAPAYGGDRVYASRADAPLGYADGLVVVEVTRDDVRRALEIEFGPDTD